MNIFHFSDISEDIIELQCCKVSVIIQLNSVKILFVSAVKLITLLHINCLFNNISILKLPFKYDK